MADTGHTDSQDQANVDRDGKTAWQNPTYAETSDSNDAYCGPGKNDYGDCRLCLDILVELILVFFFFTVPC